MKNKEERMLFALSLLVIIVGYIFIYMTIFNNPEFLEAMNSKFMMDGSDLSIFILPFKVFYFCIHLIGAMFSMTTFHAIVAVIWTIYYSCFKKKKRNINKGI